MANYWTLTYRSAKKQKSFVLINIIGLALGMASCLLIASFVQTELSYDRYHQNSNNIYRVTSELTLGKTPNMIASTNTRAAMTMKEDIPGIAEAVRLRTLRRVPVKYQNEKEFYEDNIFYTEPAFFKIFSFDIVKGNPETLLSETNTMVLTIETAKKYFGDQDPIGKTLKINGQTDYTVSGVVENVPSNSHFTFDMLLSFESLYGANGREAIESWQTPFGYFSYLLLQDGIEPKWIESQFPDLVDRNIDESWKNAGVSVKFFLQPLKNIHLHSAGLRHEIGGHGNIKYVYIFASIAAFVLFIACLNFMNLMTARSASRANEVGMRKILGSDRRSLILGFLREAVIYAFMSFILAIVLYLTTVSSFSKIAERSLGLNFLEIPWLLPAAIVVVALVGIMCGIYPAYFLSSFEPKKVITSDQDSITSGKTFRKVLVIAQFTISICLIIGTQVIFNQLDFLKNRDLGFDKNQILVIPLVTPEIRQSITSIKDRLGSHPGVLTIGSSTHVHGQRSSGGSYQPEGYDEGQTVMLDAISIDHDYIETMGMEIISGRNFSTDFPADPSQSILINETAAKEIGWDDPLHKRIKLPGQENEKTVIGVVKDFFFKSPHTKIRGLYISNESRPYNALLIKLSSTDIAATIDFIIEEWKGFDPNRSMDYYFLDTAYDEQYKAEEKLIDIFTYFTAFAIFIACLGLFGMAAFTAEQKTKEIGVRKVMGASVPRILLLLSKNIFILVLIAFLISIPISHYAMTKWLEGFEYRTDVHISLYLRAGLLALFTAVITVSAQSLKVALMNPIKSLRNE